MSAGYLICVLASDPPQSVVLAQLPEGARLDGVVSLFRDHAAELGLAPAKSQSSGSGRPGRSVRVGDRVDSEGLLRAGTGDPLLYDSVSKAARAIGVTPSAIGQALARSGGAPAAVGEAYVQYDKQWGSAEAKQASAETGLPAEATPGGGVQYGLPGVGEKWPEVIPPQKFHEGEDN